ncbi:hypothetical protein WG904_07995 [Pedobacter sp. Du54]|uniref:hypothetical protein n=1 Tax=Pedobacter anseongensis TaxID=3133439 RepID=UPI0030B71C6A
MKIKKLSIYATAILIAAFTLQSCKKTKNDPDPVEPDKSEVELSATINTNTTLENTKIYVLKKDTYTRVLSGATLTIPAGTIIKGNINSALIVEMGGKINAQGTASNPIVFTSNQPAGSRNTGDWGGIVIAGRSLVNTADGTGQYEGGVLGADVAKYGGNIADDDSGILKYARIEYAGYPVQKDKELNGLTLCGVGSKTVIENVMVSFGGDDSYEFFGGTVNAKNLIAYKGTDDDFDFDQGYNGKIQFAIAIKSPAVADQAGTSRNIENETKGVVTETANFGYSRPILSNFTFIGGSASGDAKHGANIHIGNARMVLANSIIANAKTVNLEFGDAFSAKEFKDGRTLIQNNILVSGTASSKTYEAGIFADANSIIDFAKTKMNSVLASLTFNVNMPNLKLAESTTVTPKFEGDLSSLEKATFVGAVGTTDWTTGWVSWDPQNVSYK